MVAEYNAFALAGRSCFLGMQTQGVASLCPGLCARCPFRAFIPTVLGDISSNRENIFSSWRNIFFQLEKYFFPVGEIFFPVGEIYFGNWTFFLLKLGRNIALINADTCVGHRRYLRLGLSGHKPDDLAFSFCPDYIYSRSEFRLAGAEERRGTMAEDAVGGIEENIFIG